MDESSGVGTEGRVKPFTEVVVRRESNGPASVSDSSPDPGLFHPLPSLMPGASRGLVSAQWPEVSQYWPSDLRAAFLLALPHLLPFCLAPSPKMLHEQQGLLMR